MREIPAKLQAADRDDVSPDQLPILPDWWPVDVAETEDHPAHVFTDDERRAAREAQRFTEARRGPLDGTLIMVTVVGDAPPEVLPVFDGWSYRLSHQESRPDWLVYRYSPRHSPAHTKTMLQVQETYAEHGAAHVEAAQHQAAEHDGITVERQTP